MILFPTTEAEPCGEKGCTAKVMKGRGYCGRHGGPDRWARERHTAKVRAKIEACAAREASRQAKILRNDEAKALQASAETFQQAARDSRKSWGKRGAAPGMGLSRFRNRK